jgi:hypothetical protein
MQLENSRYMLDRFEFYYDELVAGNGALEEVELLVCREVTGKFTD